MKCTAMAAEMLMTLATLSATISVFRHFAINKLRVPLRTTTIMPSPPVLTTTGSMESCGFSGSPAEDWRAVYVFVGPNRLAAERHSRSQIGQDFVVQTILGCKKNGFFIDLAANDYKRDSNSFMLETDFEWRGICIEAHPLHYQGLLKRKCTYIQAAIGSPRNKEVKFVMRNEDTYNSVLSGLDSKGTDNENRSTKRSTTMYLVPINEVLIYAHAPPRADYFSLDVEGAETIVMQGFDFKQFRVTLMTIERPRKDLKAMMNANGYKFIRALCCFGEELWMDTTHPEFTRVASDWQGSVPTKTLAAKSCMVQLGFGMPEFSG